MALTHRSLQPCTAQRAAAPFDGLKPADHIEPFIAPVDGSLASGSVDTVVANVTAHVASGICERFERARTAWARAETSVERGREYVASYVDYLHYVEALHRAGAHGATEHQTAGHGH